jgi:hydroxymethylpyrimidine pyrophosphatase-like HAD family hydrolase
VLALDYDGTLAAEGIVDDATLAALQRWRQGGRELLLVTGRERESLQETFSRLDLFDRVVAENGALLIDPKSGQERALAPPPAPAFLEALRQRDVPLSVGRVVVATWTPNEKKVLDAIRSLGLELEVIFNKGAVMVLPSGINKGVGLKAALQELGRTREQVVAAGDAENDHSLLEAAGLKVAVANALPALKEKADWVMQQPRGAGVQELIARLLD